MIPITAAIGSKSIKKDIEKVQEIKSTEQLSKPVKSDNSNLESRVTALESALSQGDFNMQMGSKQLNTPTNFSSKDLEKLYSSAMFTNKIL